MYSQRNQCTIFINHHITSLHYPTFVEMQTSACCHQLLLLQYMLTAIQTVLWNVLYMYQINLFLRCRWVHGTSKYNGRNQSGYEFSQWQKALLCKDFSIWPSPSRRTIPATVLVRKNKFPVIICMFQFILCLSDYQPDYSWTSPWSYVYKNPSAL